MTLSLGVNIGLGSYAPRVSSGAGASPDTSQPVLVSDSFELTTLEITTDIRDDSPPITVYWSGTASGATVTESDIRNNEGSSLEIGNFNAATGPNSTTIEVTNGSVKDIHYFLEDAEGNVRSTVETFEAVIGNDPDTDTYVDAVETQDGQALEAATVTAIDDFVRGLKNDGIWTAIQAMAIFGAARTLNGALVALKGTAPTGVSLVSGDYARETGIKGDGSTNAVDTNRANDADPEDDQMVAVYVTTAPTVNGNIMGTNSSGTTGNTQFNARPVDGDAWLLSRHDGSVTAGGLNAVTGGDNETGLWGVSRAASGQYVRRLGQSNSTLSVSSFAPTSAVITLLARPDGVGGYENFSDARVMFYAIGTSADLALLETRVAQLETDLAAAIV